MTLIKTKSLLEMQKEVWEVNCLLGWDGPEAKPVSFGEAMALIHSEVSEALEAWREHGTEDMTSTEGVVSNVLPKPEGVGSEFADILIRLLHYCDTFKIDLEAEYTRKIAYNRTRNFRHGGKAI